MQKENGLWRCIQELFQIEMIQNRKDEPKAFFNTLYIRLHVKLYNLYAHKTGRIPLNAGGI